MMVHGAAANMSAHSPLSPRTASVLADHALCRSRTTEARLAMVCAYMPDGCVWNGIKNVLPDSYIETISVGDVLDDDTINPCAALTDRSGCCF